MHWAQHVHAICSRSPAPTALAAQLLVGVFSIVLGTVDYTFGGTIAVMIVFSAFVQAAEGACFGVVPFVTRRSYGVVSGLVGAGGNAGSAVTQALFFADNKGLK